MHNEEKQGRTDKREHGRENEQKQVSDNIVSSVDSNNGKFRKTSKRSLNGKEYSSFQFHFRTAKYCFWNTASQNT